MITNLTVLFNENIILGQKSKLPLTFSVAGDFIVNNQYRSEEGRSNWDTEIFPRANSFLLIKWIYYFQMQTRGK